jgi:hypothetical protein
LIFELRFRVQGPFYHQAAYQSLRVWKSEMGHGYQDGPLETATFSRITQIRADPRGDLIVLDQGNHRIRKILTESMMVITLAGSGVSGIQEGAGPHATFTHLKRMALHENDVYVLDQDWIRRLDGNGTVTHLLQAPTHLEFRDLTIDNGTVYILAATLDTQRTMTGCQLYTLRNQELRMIRDGLCSPSEQSVSIHAYRGMLYFSRSGVAAMYTIQGSQVTKLFGTEGLPMASDGPLVSATTCFASDFTTMNEKLYFVSQCDSYLSLRVVDAGQVQSVSRTLHVTEQSSITSVGTSLYFLQGQQMIKIDV